MCGICGIYSPNKQPIDVEQLILMRDSMTHRGPDDRGIFLGDGIGLGFRRLSIIDLVAGNQPMYNEDGSICLVFNGEIYNYLALRRYLETRNHVFKTRSDTEVIVHLYEEYGEGFVNELNGMFAVAIWDNNQNKLVLARDRPGEKPLYYFSAAGNFYFASEIKAFLTIPQIPKVLREDLLGEFLAFGNTYGPNTLLKNIFEVLPGHILVVKGHASKMTQYWNEEYTPTIDEQEGRLKHRLEDLLKESVQMRLMSDVPLGAFLSGGVDSSLVVWCMTGFMQKPVQTFSIGFGEEGYSELHYARQVANLLRTDHHEMVIDREAFFDAMPRLIYFQDEPINHPSAIPLYFIANHAKKQGVTVLLSGEGGDELFAGYSSYSAMLRDLRLRQLLPRYLWKVGTLLFDLLGQKKYSRICERYSDTDDFLIFGTQALLSKRDLARLVPFGSNGFGYFFDLLSRQDASPLAKILYTHLKTRLVSLLMKQDKMTMATAVEVRVPFLDHRLIEMAATVPDDLKIRNGEGKYIIKRIAEDHLPHNIIYRTKVGFPVPTSDWFCRFPQYTKILTERRTTERGLFDQRVVNNLLATHTSRRYDYGPTIWNLINLEMWIRIFIEGEIPKKQFSGVGIQNPKN